jgi:hypothetical protein
MDQLQPEQQPGTSTNDYCARLPRRRHPATALGMVLLLPRTGVIAVPHTRQRDGWTVTVVGGSSETYRPGGYDLFVPDIEIATAIKVDVDKAPLVDEEMAPLANSAAYDLQVEDLGLSARAYNVLQRHNIRTLWQLAGLTEEDLLGMINFGEKCLVEVKEALAAHSTSLAVPELERLGLSHRARDVLRRHGVSTLEQLACLAKAELINMPYFGEKCLAEVKELLSAHGLALKDS